MPAPVTDPTSSPGSPQPPAPAALVAKALTRYRVMAYVVGVMLLVLVFVAMPLKYWGGQEAPMTVIGPLHGFLYVIYLLTVLDLGMRVRLPFWRLIGVMLAGTIPFLSFVAEHRITRRLHAEHVA